MIREQIFIFHVSVESKSDMGIDIAEDMLKTYAKVFSNFRKCYYASVHKVMDENLEHEINMDIQRRAVNKLDKHVFGDEGFKTGK